MSRPLRIEYPNAYYHIMNRGAGRQNVFNNEQERRLFLDIISDAYKQYGIEIHAYCSKEAGATIENGKIKNVVELNVYLNDMAALSIVNQYMLQYLTGHLPARTPLGGLTDGDFLVSMDAIVELPR
jgi:enamine deaminase RidA (YjgF/YER057c/UK114 family)